MFWNSVSMDKEESGGGMEDPYLFQSLVEQ